MLKRKFIFLIDQLYRNAYRKKPPASIYLTYILINNIECFTLYILFILIEKKIVYTKDLYVVAMIICFMALIEDKEKIFFSENLIVE